MKLGGVAAVGGSILGYAGATVIHEQVRTGQTDRQTVVILSDRQTDR